MLGEMAERVMGTRTFEETVHTVLDDVIAFQGAQYGTVQLPFGDNLIIAAQRGFDPQILQMFRHVTKDDGCACGQALRLRRSIVVADVQKDQEYAPYRDAAKRAGFRSIQSMPFTTQDEKLFAVVSVYFAAPDRQREMLAGYCGHCHGGREGHFVTAKAMLAPAINSVVKVIMLSVKCDAQRLFR